MRCSLQFRESDKCCTLIGVGAVVLGAVVLAGTCALVWWSDARYLHSPSFFGALALLACALAIAWAAALNGIDVKCGRAGAVARAVAQETPPMFVLVGDDDGQ